MKLITAQDFNQIPYNVPNALAQKPGGGVEENEQFNAYIDEKVQETMVKLLGASLYKSFIEGLDALPDEWIGTNAPGYAVDDLVLYQSHVWKSLVANNLNVIPEEGISWTMIEDDQWLMLYNGVPEYSFNANSQSWAGLKKVLIPNVFASWLTDTYDDYTKSGIATRATENATVISPGLRITNAYRDFSKRAGDYMRRNDSLYGYLIYAQTSLDHYTGFYDDVNYSTFDSYLQNSFTDPGRMNIWDI
jgi:hypothetical protein